MDEAPVDFETHDPILQRALAIIKLGQKGTPTRPGRSPSRSCLLISRRE